MQKITADNILHHILQKKKELEALEKMNEEFMKEAVDRARSGGRSKALKKFKEKVARNSIGSSPSQTSEKANALNDFTNSYVANRPRSKNAIDRRNYGNFGTEEDEKDKMLQP